MNIALEILSRAVLHSSLLDRALSALFDYEQGKITADDARTELDRIDEEFERVKQEHWNIVNS
jgi:hypothetical protein